jgi:hypothetical protein
MELHAAEGNGPVAETIEPHFSPEGESRKGLIERIGNETHAALRQLADVDGTRQALAEE